MEKTFFFSTLEKAWFFCLSSDFTYIFLLLSQNPFLKKLSLEAAIGLSVSLCHMAQCELDYTSFISSGNSYSGVEGNPDDSN